MVNRHLFTVEEYYRMGESGVLGHEPRIELIEGEVVDMSPIGSKHAYVVDLLVKLINQTIDDSLHLRGRHPVRLSDVSEPEPDIAIVRGPGTNYLEHHPLPNDVMLLIEVSDTTLKFDLETKAPLYAKHGIPEYWVVDLEGKQLHLFRQPEEGVYLVHETLDAAGTVEVPACPGARLALADILV